MRLSCRRLFWIILILAIGVGIYFAKSWYNQKIGVPPYQAVNHIVSLEQGWSKEHANWYHQATQGSTFLIKYNWFLALEQPILTLGFPAAPFRDKNYLGAYGFLFDSNNPENPDELPIGFAKNEHYVDPITQQPMITIGLTCAACHTGQLNYRGTGVRIEGGQSMANVIKFQTAFGFAMLLTYYDPLRFDRFAKNVLGAKYSAQNKTNLKTEFYQTLQNVLKAAKLDEEIPPLTEEGFGRLDALNRIGNYVFAVELYKGNYRVIDAPVSFPFLWGTSWFDWVEYNGSVLQPMTRNAGEALGVFASINLTDPSQTLFQSSLDVENIYHLEKMIAGNKPFEGLKAPQWPEQIFGEINQQKATQGAKLYQTHCQSCHLPPMDSEEICEPQYWTNPNKWGKRFLKLKLVNVDLLGTDDQEVKDWAKRFVETKQVGLGVVKGELGLPLTVEKAVNLKYDALGFSQEQRDEYNGYRENKVRSPLCYKARPLDGIWATPPFLHNGSVSNLYQLLSPVSERDKTFYVGSQEFDPQSVGYNTDYLKNALLFDTTTIGNHNTGHEYRDLTEQEQQTWIKDAQGHLKFPFRGVLGKAFTPEERWALVEYLKTLKSRDLNVQTTVCPKPLMLIEETNKEEVDTCVH
ncbi:MAG: hypothetical protein RIT27_160 [Pseudomonadota bacterium]|jgi:hypothetical protein